MDKKNRKTSNARRNTLAMPLNKVIIDSDPLVQIKRSITLGGDVDAMTIVWCLITPSVSREGFLADGIATTQFMSVENSFDGIMELHSWVDRELKKLPEDVSSSYLNEEEKIVTGIESTSVYSHTFMRYLADSDLFSLVFINAGMQPKKSKTEVKADKADARSIALGLMSGSVRGDYPFKLMPKIQETIRKFTRIRSRKVNQRTRLGQQLSSTLTEYAVTLQSAYEKKERDPRGQRKKRSSKSAVWSSSAGIKVLQYLINIIDEEERFLQEQDLVYAGLLLGIDDSSSICHLRGFLTMPRAILKEIIGRFITEIVSSDEEVSRLEVIATGLCQEHYPEIWEILESVPNLGPIGKCCLIGELGDREYILLKYDCVEKFIKAAGLLPQGKTSGRKNLGKYTSHGNAYVEYALKQMARSFIQSPPAKDFTDPQITAYHGQVMSYRSRKGQDASVAKVAQFFLRAIYFAITRFEVKVFARKNFNLDMNSLILNNTIFIVRPGIVQENSQQLMIY